MRRGRLLAIAGAVGAIAAPGGWLVTDRLEQRNDFCNACHLEPGVALHAAVRRDFDAAQPVSLSAAHAAAAAAQGEAFRCIDCHGGVSPLGRLRVKALAARDALVYLSGRFEEPDGMRFPLWDEDCAQCHATFDESEVEPWRTPRFHQLAVHNVELGVACVECHVVHEPGDDPRAHFLQAARVRSRCALCHPDFEEGRG